MRGAALLLGVLLLGCEGEAPTPVVMGEVALLDAMAWAPSARDPFPAHRPETVRCADIGWVVEGGSLEVDTGACNYLSVEQPLRADVPAGTPIVVRLWHQVLHADSPAHGHAALLIGDDLLWTYEAPIPGPGAIHEAVIEAPRGLRAGEPVLLHLHNHGQYLEHGRSFRGTAVALKRRHGAVVSDPLPWLDEQRSMTSPRWRR